MLAVVRVVSSEGCVSGFRNHWGTSPEGGSKYCMPAWGTFRHCGEVAAWGEHSRASVISSSRAMTGRHSHLMQRRPAPLYCSFTPRQLLDVTCALDEMKGTSDHHASIIVSLLEEACRVCLMGDVRPNDDDDGGREDTGGEGLAVTGGSGRGMAANAAAEDGLKGGDACRLLGLLTSRGRLTVQHLGLVCMMVRERGGGGGGAAEEGGGGGGGEGRGGPDDSWRGRRQLGYQLTNCLSLSEADLRRLSEAVAYLGEEGLEMAQEVLPGQVYSQIAVRGVGVQWNAD